MIKPVPFLFAALSLTALAFFVIGASTNKYIVNSQETTSEIEDLAVNYHYGPFYYCRGVAEETAQCSRITAYCRLPALASFLGTNELPSLDHFDMDCTMFNGFRAILMVALVLAALSSIFAFLFVDIAAADKKNKYVFWALLTGLLSGIMGMISMAIIAHEKGHDSSNMVDEKFGYSFGFATAAWPLIFVSSIAYFFTARVASEEAPKA